MKTQKGQVVAREVQADKESLAGQILVSLGRDGTSSECVTFVFFLFAPLVASCVPIYLLRTREREGERVREGKKSNKRMKLSLSGWDAENKGLNLKEKVKSLW